ncbi:putative nucleic acid-binding protein, contains PIN domain [Caldisphaera lagunensis DSM 15908]|uniref:Putative nucleic acid-binding protein, contains PIN domain n=1 Tax=Caldisphaera lagunensis (strain DSM 15908 / JCM 11604 / ANMR 0165 / IC-154) TaxID=1056495 RepID=L0ACP3_CALLD|nr:nucleic acid-binding protein [Caldisphaera lagunensis]AFZ70917.1 putative nucleic acid-binding protein, contains PIN domain [Caldisphaera lagunensis DSM 15908]
MVTNIEISGYSENALDALVRAGVYSNKTEAVREAIRRFIDSFDMKEIAFRAYKEGKISFQLAIEISGMGIEEVIWYFLKKNVSPEIGVIDIKELNENIEEIEKRNSLVFDLSSTYTILELDKIDLIKKLDKRLLISKETNNSIRSLIMRYSKLRGSLVYLGNYEVIQVKNPLNEFARKNGITLQEAEAISISKKENAILVSDDIRTRQTAKSKGIVGVPTLSLFLYSKKFNIIDEKQLNEIIAKMGTIPLIIPSELFE